MTNLRVIRFVGLPIFAGFLGHPSFAQPATGSDGIQVAVVNEQGLPLARPERALPTGEVDSAPGICTVNGTGCGRGAVLNVAADGSVSLNSPANSAIPGHFISIYGTGNGPVYNDPADGTPAPGNPLARASVGGGPVFDFSLGNEGTNAWVGRAPGLVGVDQFNFLVPTTVRQGCAVPLQIWNDNISVPVTISIASDGGSCVDPPSQGYGDILWEKTTTNDSAPDFTVTTSETVTVPLQSSPGRQPPEPITYAPGWTLPGIFKLFGPACAIPGYKSLDAGSVTVQGPGPTGAALAPAPLPGGTVMNNDGTLESQSEFSQAAGLTVYQATLPSGTIKPGAFTVSATGGTDVGAFQSTVQIGSPIQIITALAGEVLDGSGPPFQIQWTGGDANSWVVPRLIAHHGAFDTITQGWVARASDHQIMIQGIGEPVEFTIIGPVEMIIDVVPDPSQTSPITAPNLSLGGRTQWKYSYHFEGLIAK